MPSELEQLRSENRALLEALDRIRQYEDLEQQLTDARAEGERLREALEDMVPFFDGEEGSECEDCTGVACSEITHPEYGTADFFGNCFRAKRCKARLAATLADTQGRLKWGREHPETKPTCYGHPKTCITPLCPDNDICALASPAQTEGEG